MQPTIIFLNNNLFKLVAGITVLIQPEIIELALNKLLTKKAKIRLVFLKQITRLYS